MYKKTRVLLLTMICLIWYNTIAWGFDYSEEEILEEQSFVCRVNDDGSYSIEEYNWLGYGEIAEIVLPKSLGGITITRLDKDIFEPVLQRLNSDPWLFFNANIYIPETIIELESSSFMDIYVNSINVADANPIFASINGVLFRKENRELLVFPRGNRLKTYTVPEGIEIIGEKAFDCTDAYREEMNRSFVLLDTVEIPSSVVDIRQGALAGVKNVLISPENSVFEMLNPNNSQGDILYDVQNRVAIWHAPQTKLYRDGIFGDAQFVFLPEDTVEIADYCFYKVSFEGTDELISAGFNCPESIKRIGNYAFYSTDLEFCTIPNTVEEIGDCAFANCDNLNFLYLISSNNVHGDLPSEMIEDEPQLKYIGKYAFANTGLSEFEIPDTVRDIGKGAFAGSNIQSINWPEFALMIEDSMFESCKELNDITIPPLVFYIGKRAFYECDFENIVLPEELLEIGAEAFSDCYSLVDIVLPDNVEIIGDKAFNNCYSLSKVDLSDNLRTIGDYAFGKCYDLTDIVLPEKLESIGENAFSDCRKVSRLTIPESVTYIGDGAFAYETDIYVTEGSYAHQWAKQNGRKFNLVVDTNNIDWLSGNTSSQKEPTPETVKPTQSEMVAGYMYIDYEQNDENWNGRLDYSISILDAGNASIADASLATYGNGVNTYGSAIAIWNSPYGFCAYVSANNYNGAGVGGYYILNEAEVEALVRQYGQDPANVPHNDRES